MKIAFIGQKGIPAVYGGVERHVEELSTRLVDLGYDVSVYTRPHYTTCKKESFKGIKLISLPSLHSKHFDAISHTFLATLHALKQDYNIIHYHSIGPALLCWIPRILKPRAKVVVTFHCIDRQHQKWGRIARLMLWLGEFVTCKFAHEVITVSRTLKHYAYEVYKRETNYIPNGISEMQSLKPSIIKEQFGLEGNDYILVVSRLIPHKGIHYLIKAYQRINPNLKLVITGDSSFTDDYVRKLKRLAGGSKHIIFTGFQTGPALAELFTNAYLYVQPSESEGLPIAVLEAAAYGNCVLASDIPANMEIIKNCGLNFENKSVNDLVHKLELLINSPQEVESSGKEARKYVLENYNWADIVKSTDYLYQKVLVDEEIELPAKATV